MSNSHWYKSSFYTFYDNGTLLYSNPKYEYEMYWEPNDKYLCIWIMKYFGNDCQNIHPTVYFSPETLNSRKNVNAYVGFGWSGYHVDKNEMVKIMYNKWLKLQT